MLEIINHHVQSITSKNNITIKQFCSVYIKKTVLFTQPNIVLQKSIITHTFKTDFILFYYFIFYIIIYNGFFILFIFFEVNGTVKKIRLLTL